MRKTCNNCRNKECTIWNRSADGKLIHSKKAMLAVVAEKANKLVCHKVDNQKKWKFTNLVSKVTIVNPENPVIRLLMHEVI